jgi:hypothetical protein
MKKLKIYVFASDYNEESYLDLQIESFNRNFKRENEELIIVNGSISNKEKIESICDKNGIECLTYDRSFSVYHEYPDLNNVFGFYGYLREIIKNSSDYIMSIHADMFFIDSLDYISLFNKKCFWFLPRYTSDLFYVWEGIFMIDCEEFNKKGYGEIFNMSGFNDTTTGLSRGDGCSISHHSLERMNESDLGYFEFWNLEDTDGTSYDTNLNGCCRYFFNVDEKKLRGTENQEGPRLDGKRTFRYEESDENYTNVYIDKFIKIKQKYVDPYTFPSPINFDIINPYDKRENEFIIHFKSGSGYQSYFNPDYKNKKIDCLKRIIQNSKKS